MPTHATPTVHPQTTTTYYVNVNDGNGCEDTDSVLVNVVSKVQLALSADTVICLTDTAQLHPVTNALHFRWSPPETLSSDTAKEPLAVPLTATAYHVIANIGTCETSGDITVKPSPYPVADAGIAVPICYGATTQLNGSFTGTGFTWSPANTLLTSKYIIAKSRPRRNNGLYVNSTRWHNWWLPKAGERYGNGCGYSPGSGICRKRYQYCCRAKFAINGFRRSSVPLVARNRYEQCRNLQPCC